MNTYIKKKYVNICITMDPTDCIMDSKDYIYVLMPENGGEWEDIVIIKLKEDAINASIKFYKWRVEIFEKNQHTFYGYIPTYNYIKNGKLYFVTNQNTHLPPINLGSVI